MHEVETFTKLATNMNWKLEAELEKSYMSSTVKISSKRKKYVLEECYIFPKKYFESLYVKGL